MGKNKHEPIGNGTNYNTLISVVRAVALMWGNLDRILALGSLSLAVTECLKLPFLHFSFGALEYMASEVLKSSNSGTPNPQGQFSNSCS